MPFKSITTFIQEVEMQNVIWSDSDSAIMVPHTCEKNSSISPFLCLDHKSYFRVILSCEFQLKHQISYFCNGLLEYYPLHQAWCKTWSSLSTEKTNWQSQLHKVSSKCPPLARTQARKRVAHWSTAPSVSDCSKPRHTCSRRCRSSSMSWTWHWCYIYVTSKINK